MASRELSQMTGRMFRRVRPLRNQHADGFWLLPASSFQKFRLSTTTCQRPVLRPRNSLRLNRQQLRNIFIQTEQTPNVDAVKFNPDHRILPAGLSVSFIEYLTRRSTLAPPYPSPLAAALFNIDGVKSVFYGPNFITVTKEADANWAHVKPEVFSLITEAIVSGEQIVNTVEKEHNVEKGQDTDEDDSLNRQEDDEVVGMIKELLETRIRPAIQEDGGDIEYRGFENGMVLLKLRGACRTCDSSTVTLKNGIENMMMHYIEEVKGVTQVLDKEEEIAMEEFAKFEEKLRHQKGPDAIASTIGKGSLDTVE